MAPLTPDKSLSLLNQKATFFASELIGKNNPVLEAMNEISSDMAFTQAGKYLEWQYGGKGIYLGEYKGLLVPKILVFGAGSLGRMIIDRALLKGLEIFVTDTNEENLEQIKNDYDEKRLHVCPFLRKKIATHLKKIDVLFMTHLNPGNKSEIIFSREEINNMEKGSVIIDLAIDHGGNLETSRATTPDDPIYKQDNLIYFCVPNMPSALPHTSSQILSKNVLPFIKKIAEQGLKEAVVSSTQIQSGLVFHRGKIVNEMVAKSLGYEHIDINELFDLNI
jgi:alanine dehydrogenase